MKKLILLGILSLIIGLLEALEAFNSINNVINAELPYGGNLTSATTKLADTSSILGILTLVVIVETLRGKIKPKDAIRPYVSIFLVLATVGILKIIYHVPRPISYGKGIESLAFPSGHTAKASALANYLGDLWPRARFLIYLFPVTIGITRILHVHWFSDVLFSLFYGAFIDESVKVVWRRMRV